MTVTPLGRDQDYSLKNREPDMPAPWFLDLGGDCFSVPSTLVTLNSLPADVTSLKDKDFPEEKMSFPSLGNLCSPPKGKTLSNSPVYMGISIADVMVEALFSLHSSLKYYAMLVLRKESYRSIPAASSKTCVGRSMWYLHQ
ncbi:hypothetical protein STEG23_029939 [Scotinomys teguina]